MEQQLAIVHLICGPTAAGKTTYAAALATRAHAVHFSLEEWMSRLYWGPDAPSVRTLASLAWPPDQIARCEAQMWAIADQMLAIDVSVIFDVDLSTREHRDDLRDRALQVGAEAKLHYLDVDRETRKARVIRRNESATPLAFAMTDETFDFLEGEFQPPSDDELYDAMIVCESQTPGSLTVA
jgi:predicted kinase